MSSSSNRLDVFDESFSRSEEQQQAPDAGINRTYGAEGDLSRAAIVDDEIEMEAPDAKIARIARLEALVKIQQEEYDSRVGKLQQDVLDLKVEQAMAAWRPKDPAPQLSVPTGSSDQILRAEISRLQQEIAAKDVIIARRDRTLELHDACLEGLIGYIRYIKEVATQNDDQSPTAPPPAMVPADAAPASQETLERDNFSGVSNVQGR